MLSSLSSSWLQDLKGVSVWIIVWLAAIVLLPPTMPLYAGLGERGAPLGMSGSSPESECMSSGNVTLEHAHSDISSSIAGFTPSEAQTHVASLHGVQAPDRGCPFQRLSGRVPKVAWSWNLLLQVSDLRRGQVWDHDRGDLQG